MIASNQRDAAAPVNPAILELARILAREAVRQFLEEKEASPSAEERYAE